MLSIGLNGSGNVFYMATYFVYAARIYIGNLCRRFMHYEHKNLIMKSSVTMMQFGRILSR